MIDTTGFWSRDTGGRVDGTAYGGLATPPLGACAQQSDTAVPGRRRHRERAPKRRRQLTRQTGLANAILNPPTAEAAAFLDLLGMQRDGRVLVFSIATFNPGLARLAIMKAARLHDAIGSVQSHRSAARRKAEWHLGALDVFLTGCVRFAPHLVHTRQIDQPWSEWCEDPHAVRSSHPQWSPGIDADADYLGRPEAATAHEDEMRERIATALDELQALLGDLPAKGGI